MTRNYTGRGSEVIALLRLRKYIRNVVTLVTPRIHIHWCKEDPERRVQNDPLLRPVMRDAVARHLEAVLDKRIGVPLAQLHLRNSRLPLLHRGQAQEETRERGPRAVVRSCLGRKAVGELVIAAVLKESPHGPNE